jgi:hypothetical protein
LLITDRSGAIREGLQGGYERDLRLLSQHRLFVYGQAPRLDSVSAVEAHSLLGY